MVHTSAAGGTQRKEAALIQKKRKYLATVPGVAHFQDEHVQFGGAGITVVDLK